MQANLNDTRYCSVSAYELLADTRRYDGKDVVVTGYLQFLSDGAAFSFDKRSINLMLTDYVIGAHIQPQIKEKALQHVGKLVNVYGKYSHKSVRYFMGRGELVVVAVRPHYLQEKQQTTEEDSE